MGGVNMAKNSLDLRKELSLEDFFRFSKKVAIDYATSAASTAVSALTEKYDITKSTFYTLLALSITHHLVTDKAVQSIREKLQANLSAHGCNGYYSAVKHNKLLEERKNYSAFKKHEIEYIAKYYASNPQLSKADIAAIFQFYNTRPLELVLKKACVELIISDKVFEALRTRAIDNATNLDYTIQFFCELARYRDRAKKIKKQSQPTF